MTRLTLLGSSSGRNAGDAALMRAIVEAVRAEIPGAHFEIPTINPAFLRRSYPADVVTPVPILPWNLSLRFFGVPVFRSVARTEATLIFDAILFDRSLRNPLFNYLWPLQYVLPYAKARGRKVVFYDVGVGPVHTAAGRRVLRRVLATGDLFTIRDPDSLALARDVGLPDRPIHLTADAAFDHPPAPAERVDEIHRGLELPPGRAAVGFNVNVYLDTWTGDGGARIDRRHFVSTMAALADRMVDRWGADVVFFVTQHMDEGITSAVVSAMEHREHVRVLSNRAYSPEELQGVMARMDLFFGMRLHSLLLAASQCVPVVGLVYQIKVESLLRYLGLAEAALPFAPFDIEPLWSSLDARWSLRQTTRAHLEEIVPRMRALAREAAVRTAALLARGGL